MGEYQPNEGKKHGGGLRVGNMEKDSFNSHGVPYVINERMMISSDAKKVTICPTCKKKVNTGIIKCNVCGDNAKTMLMPSAAPVPIAPDGSSNLVYSRGNGVRRRFRRYSYTSVVLG